MQCTRKRCPSEAVEGYRRCSPCQEVSRQQKVRWYGRHREERETRKKAIRADTRREIFDRYGRACVCCGETVLEFLTLDHINGDGKQHRQEISRGLGGYNFYRNLRELGYPDCGLQTLCWNCHMGKDIFRGCPHQLSLVPEGAF